MTEVSFSLYVFITMPVSHTLQMYLVKSEHVHLIQIITNIITFIMHCCLLRSTNILHIIMSGLQTSQSDLVFVVFDCSQLELGVVIGYV